MQNTGKPCQQTIYQLLCRPFFVPRFFTVTGTYKLIQQMKGNKEVWVLRQLLILNRNANLFTLSPRIIPCTKKRACRAILGDKTQFNSIFVKKRDKQKTPLSTQPSFYPDCLKLHCKPHKRKIYTQLNGKKHPKQARGMLLQINIPRRNRGVS